MNAAAAGIVQTHDFPRFSHIEARAAHARRASVAGMFAAAPSCTHDPVRDMESLPDCNVAAGVIAACDPMPHARRVAPALSARECQPASRTLPGARMHRHASRPATPHSRGARDRRQTPG
ncbi:hypothetical protein [Cupriavidus sp. H18C2]|uniref:hypothetical protein n=1 Tax=Cupriavidus sp. H18C2 TaxID=3241602 RepID=UPI003BF89AE9